MPNINLRLTELEHAELREWAHGSRRSLQREIVFRLFDGVRIGAVPAEIATASPLEQSVGRANTAAVNQVDRMRAADVVPSVPDNVPMRAHMRLDRRAIECSNRVAAGEVCQVCGAVGR